MFKNNKKGFSLVELVIVIAILAILIAVLAPSLMTYTERSRAQKDVTTMDEVVNAVQLAMADQKCYDEMIKYSCSNNFITYTDSSGNYGQIIADGEFWAPDGSGRATTITFNPTRKGNETYYVLETGIINDMTYGNGSVAENRVMQGAQTEKNQCYFKNAALNSNMDSYTYNRVRQIIGDSTIATSATYANSSFTIFIRFNQKDGVTVADVNGSFNGTNLTADSSASKGSGTSTYNPDTGEANTTVTDPGTTDVNYTGSALGGTGSFTGGNYSKIEDYKQPTYVENLQKENEFEYYSSLKLAVDDVNNNTIGKNADCHKHEAVAGICEKDGNILVALLKDHQTETIEIKTTLTLVLGGKTLSSDNASAIHVKSGTTTIDGRILNSTISTTEAQEETTYCVLSDSSIILLEGSYIGNNTRAAICSSRSSSLLEMNNCTTTTTGNRQKLYAVFAQSTNNKIINCNISATNSNKSTNTNNMTIGLYVENNGTVKDCEISSIGASSRYKKESGNEYWSGACGYVGLQVDNITVSNCKITSNITAIHNQDIYGKHIVSNCDIVGGVQSVYDQDGSTYYQNCNLRQTGNTLGYPYATTSAQSTIDTYNGSSYFDNCTMKGKYFINIPQNCNVYISNCEVSCDNLGYIYTSGKLHLGLRNNIKAINFNNPNIVDTSEIYSPPK